MRLRLRWSRRPASLACEERACGRWERKVLLSASDDLCARDAEALRHHLASCSGCRAEAARARALREQCLRAAARREADAPVLGTWEAISGRLASRPAAPASPELEPRLAPAFRARPRPLATSLVAAAALLVVCGSLVSVILDRGAGTDTAALEARWSERWDEFVSGAGVRPEPSFDPFAEIPNPDVIEF